jgi:hypothetical protein
MSFKYCPECGAKTPVGSSVPKFCSGCGESFSQVVRPSSGRLPDRQVSRSSSRDEQDLEPQGFSIPDRLEYEIEGKRSQKTTIKDIAATPPDENRYQNRPEEPKSNRKVKKMSLKEYTALSMQECQSSKSKEISE